MKKIVALLVMAGLLMPLAGVAAQGEEACLSAAAGELKTSRLTGAAWFTAVDRARQACASAPPTPTPAGEILELGQPLSPDRQFNVSTTSTVNLRTGPGTNYEKAGQTRPGNLMKVLATGEDTQGREWYRIDGGRWLAAWLTTRGPDALIQTDEIYRDEDTGCAIVVDRKRGDRDLAIVLAGAAQNDVTVDVYRPNENIALRVEAQLDKTFIDTGDSYIYQYYSWRIGWPNGLYRLEVSQAANTSMLAWQMDQAGDYTIHVYCD